MNGDLPMGWVETTLGEIATWSSGGTPKAGVQEYYGGDIPWTVIGDLNDGVIRATRSRLTERGLASSSARVVPAGSILVAMYGSIGKLGIAGIPLATNQAIAVALPAEGVYPSFLFWFLRSERSRLSSAGKGATQSNISQSILKRWPVALPPVAEQLRIVGAIDREISRLDAVESQLRRTQRRCRALDQDVVRLLPRETPTVSLASLLREPLRNGHSIKRSDGGTTRVFTLTAVTTGDFGEHNTKLADPGSKDLTDLFACPGDIFVQRSNTPELVGTARLYNGPAEFAVFPDLLIRVRSDRTHVEPQYLEVVLRSDAVRRYFRRQARGIAGSMPKIDQGTIAETPIPLPPLEEQRRIVAEVERQLSILNSVKVAVDHALVRCGQLRRSILERAFTGRLVPQDPDDEPAEVLLERIRSERATSPKPGRANTPRAGGTPST